MKKVLFSLAFLAALIPALNAQIVITEIMYNPPPTGTDTLEYVELYNNTNAPVDVSNWTFTEGFVFTFPAGTTMAAGAYVIITENKTYFDARFPGRTSFQWDGALTNSGEDIKLAKADTTQVVDYVDYKAAAPWPTAPNGGGSSLVLCDYNADNNVAANWAAASTATGVVIAGTPIFANPGAASACNSGGPSYPPYTIAQVTTENANGVADSINVFTELTGTAYGVNLRPAGLQFTLIDDANTAGVAVFRFDGNFGYTVAQGDKIKVRGRIQQFNGLTQIAPDTILFVSGNNPLVSPDVVPLHTEATESRLIRINSLTLTNPADWATGQGTGFTARALAAGNTTDTIYIRVDNDTEVFNSPAPTTPFDLIGIGGQFDNSSPYTSGYQVSPRFNSDLIPIVGTHTADFSAEVRLSPNPAADQLLVQTELEIDAIRLLSPLGQVLRHIQPTGVITHIPLAHLPAGIYFLQVEKDGGVWTSRVVKR